MTKIVFYKCGDVFYGFEEHGHTGYGESGNDVLCAALSAMTMLIINAIEVAYASEAEYTIDEETADHLLNCARCAERFRREEKICYFRPAYRILLSIERFNRRVL